MTGNQNVNSLFSPEVIEMANQCASMAIGFAADAVAAAKHRVLPVSGMMLSSRCRAGCTYCAIERKPDGPMMPWELFTAILTNRKIKLQEDGNEGIFIGDGEPLLYTDKTENKILLDALEKLVCEKKLNVIFTTRGLIPQNREIGLAVLQNLDVLGRSRKKLHIGVSFDLLSRIPKDEYLSCMPETFRLLHKQGIEFGVIALFDPNAENKNGREKATKTALKSVLPKKSGINIEYRPLGAFGNTQKHHQINNPGGDWLTNGCKHFGDFATEPVFSINAVGDVELYCLGFGEKGTVFGNVTRNTVQHIYAAHAKGVLEHI